MMRAAAILSWLLLALLPAAAQSLLKQYPLDGEVKTTRWTFLASQNPNRYPDSFPAMRGTMSVAPPGYGAGMGLYSWTGGYSVTVTQPATAAPAFDVHHVVFQLDATWDPATTFPAGGGPRLSYNGGDQRLAAVMPMMVDGTRVVENETGVPEMEGIDSFSYRGITWQWDLTGITEEVRTVQVHMPFANHTSVVGARIDVASRFTDISGEDTPLQAWRNLHFGSRENSGPGADGHDFDGDGIPNLIEYVLGSSPVLAAEGRSSAPVPLWDGSRMRLAFRMPAAPPADAIYRVQVSDSLSGWKTLATKAGSGSWIWSGSGESRVTVAAAADGGVVTEVGDESAGQARRWMRLEVSY